MYTLRCTAQQMFRPFDLANPAAADNCPSKGPKSAALQCKDLPGGKISTNDYGSKQLRGTIHLMKALWQIARRKVEELPKKILDEEDERLCNARRYENNAESVDARAGHYVRKLPAKAGNVDLKLLK